MPTAATGHPGVPGLPAGADLRAARFLLHWATQTPIRTYLITEPVDPAWVVAVAVERLATPEADLGVDLAMRILVVAGVDPDLLIALGQAFDLSGTAGETPLQGVLHLARAADPLPPEIAAACRRVGLGAAACAAWTARFGPDLLARALAAGCSGPELRGFLDVGSAPSAQALAALAALRHPEG